MRKNKGFTLIETLVGSAIFVVLALSAYRAFGVLMDAVTASQAKLAATTLANEKFEIIRNLPYDDVGIVAGLPVGKIQGVQTIMRDGYSFDIQTIIRSVDDPFDGTICPDNNPPSCTGTPKDLSPADYKLADLDITCSNCKIFPLLKFTTLVAPHALETASTNGALFIQVIDAEGHPVSGASVHIVNTQTNPYTIIDDTTDNTGFVRIVDAPPGVNAYNIIATKSLYTEDQTYPFGGAAGTDPNQPDPTVVLQQVSQTSLSIDKVSSLTVTTTDSSCVALPNIDFSLTGTKLIGAPDILKYPIQNLTTDAGGIFVIPDLEWDTYSMSLSPAPYQLIGTSLPTTFTVNPNEILNMLAVLALPSDPTLIVSVNDSGGNPIDGATVRLEKALPLPSFDETKTTNSEPCALPGKVFWNNLGSGTYTLTVSKAGYQDSVTSVDMSSALQNKDIILNP